jgi:hypothetical protein
MAIESLAVMASNPALRASGAGSGFSIVTRFLRTSSGLGC